VLYQSQEQHSDDCESYPFEKIPGRVFLDTNIVNALVKYAGCVFEQEPIPDSLPTTMAHDIEALMHIFQVGARANWDLVASLKTLDEIAQTPSETLRATLSDYAIEIVENLNQATASAYDLGRRVVGCDFFNALPDGNDRELLAHAIGLNCDAFCTADRSTIVRKRESLPKIAIRIVTPVEWWRHIKPWAGLWL
jgi:predicted nucleic acid-binding protein